MNGKVKYGKGNLIAGWLLMVLFFLLGWYLHGKGNGSTETGFLGEYLRRAHTHGLTFGMLNLLIGLSLDQSGLGARAKQAASWLAILGGFLFPIGIVMKACPLSAVSSALFHGGGTLMLLAVVLMLIGYITLPKNSNA